MLRILGVVMSSCKCICCPSLFLSLICFVSIIFSKECFRVGFSLKIRPLFLLVISLSLAEDLILSPFK